MPPVKFDDIPKTANEVLNDDYQEKGYQMKAKQKTNFDGAVVTTTVDLFPEPAKDAKPKDGKDKEEKPAPPVVTPAKLSWKIPKPFKINGVSVDKLEMDSAGKLKLETSCDKALHTVPDLKVEVKSDLADPSKITGGCTYTGIKDLFIKAETKVMKPADFTAETTYMAMGATCGIKWVCGTKPDLGVRYTQGPFFCALTTKEKLSLFSAFGFYKVKDDLKLACTYAYKKPSVIETGEKKGEIKPSEVKFSFGIAYEIMKGTLLKAKAAQDKSISLTVKHELCKGFTILGGGKYNTAKKTWTAGLQFSIE